MYSWMPRIISLASAGTVSRRQVVASFETEPPPGGASCRQRSTGAESSDVTRGLGQQSRIASGYLAVPEGASPLVGTVDVLRIAPPQRHYQLGHRSRLARRQQQVHMIGHEHIGMQRTASFTQRLAKPVEIGFVIVFAEEAGLAIMAALHDVQRHTIQMNTCSTGHAQIVAEEYSTWPL